MRRDAGADALRRFRDLGDDRQRFVAEGVDADADAADEERDRERRAERARDVVARERVDQGAQREAQEQPEDDRDEDRLRLLQRDDAGERRDHRERGAAHVHRHADDERLALRLVGRAFSFARFLFAAGRDRLFHAG